MTQPYTTIFSKQKLVSQMKTNASKRMRLTCSEGCLTKTVYHSTSILLALSTSSTFPSYKTNGKMCRQTYSICHLSILNDRFNPSSACLYLLLQNITLARPQPASQARLQSSHHRTRHRQSHSWIGLIIKNHKRTKKYYPILIKTLIFNDYAVVSCYILTVITN